MKGIYGLLVALALGVAGGMLNWNYIQRKSLEVETVSFVGIAEGADLRQGDIFLRSHFAEVQIPKNRVGNLEQHAHRWEALGTLIDTPVIRPDGYQGGELVLKEDTWTAPKQGRPLAENEDRLGVPVDTRNFVPSLSKPGDFVSFIVPRPPGVRPAPEGSTAPKDDGATEIIGPFEIWSIGARTASTDVARGSRQSLTQENILQVVVKKEDGLLEAKARKLTDLLLTTNFQRVMVLAHPRTRIER